MSDGKVDIPQAMIDKARDEFSLHHTVADADDTGWLWRCDCGEVASAADEDGAFADGERHTVRAALAAALAECEVAEDWIVTGLPGGGCPPYRHVWADQAGAEEFVAKVNSRALAAYEDAWVSGPTLLHRWRLVVVTPAQEETARA